MLKKDVNYTIFLRILVISVSITYFIVQHTRYKDNTKIHLSTYIHKYLNI